MDSRAAQRCEKYYEGHAIRRTLGHIDLASISALFFIGVSIGFYPDFTDTSKKPIMGKRSVSVR